MLLQLWPTVTQSEPPPRQPPVIWWLFDFIYTSSHNTKRAEITAFRYHIHQQLLHLKPHRNQAEQSDGTITAGILATHIIAGGVSVEWGRQPCEKKWSGGLITAKQAWELKSAWCTLPSMDMQVKMQNSYSEKAKASSNRMLGFGCCNGRTSQKLLQLKAKLWLDFWHISARHRHIQSESYVVDEAKEYVLKTSIHPWMVRHNLLPRSHTGPIKVGWQRQRGPLCDTVPSQTWPVDCISSQNNTGGVI